MGFTLAPTEIVLVLLLPVLYVGSIVWAYRDAEARGTGGMLVAAFVALVPWPLGLVAWAFIRPPEAA